VLDLELTIHSAVNLPQQTVRFALLRLSLMRDRNRHAAIKTARARWLNSLRPE